MFKKHQKNPTDRYRHVENRRLLAVIYSFLRLSVILVMIAQIFNRNFYLELLCILTLVLFMMPSLIERQLRIDLPDTLEVIILFFIFAAEILGEIQAYYIHFPYWDTMLHTLNGFLCAAIGFSLVDLLDRTERFSFKLSPVFMALTAFCFSMTVGVLWEFFEHFVDTYLLYDMQKDTIVNAISTVMLDETQTNKVVHVKDIADVILVHSDGTTQALGLGGYLDLGLYDTMKDLFVNFIGAVVFSIVGFFYIKNRGRGWFARRFIPNILYDTAPEGAAGGESAGAQACEAGNSEAAACAEAPSQELSGTEPADPAEKQEK